ARIDETVEQVEGGFFVGRPAEDVAAENQRGNFKTGAAQCSLLQVGLPSGIARSISRRRAEDRAGMQIANDYGFHIRPCRHHDPVAAKTGLTNCCRFWDLYVGAAS